jgi:hypothetical protein
MPEAAQEIQLGSIPTSKLDDKTFDLQSWVRNRAARLQIDMNRVRVVAHRDDPLTHVMAVFDKPIEDVPIEITTEIDSGQFVSKRTA